MNETEMAFNLYVKPFIQKGKEDEAYLSWVKMWKRIIEIKGFHH